MKNGTYYFFDCCSKESLDGRFFTAEDLRLMLDNPNATERDFKRLAAKYETELTRYTYKNGIAIEEKTLYDPWSDYDT